jgi:hypothetical protein
LGVKHGSLEWGVQGWNHGFRQVVLFLRGLPVGVSNTSIYFFYLSSLIARSFDGVKMEVAVPFFVRGYGNSHSGNPHQKPAKSIHPIRYTGDRNKKPNRHHNGGVFHLLQVGTAKSNE